MMQVKLDGQIEVATFTGTESKVAVVDQNGKRYALLQDSKTGALSAWSGDTSENSIDCVLVESFIDPEAAAKIERNAALCASHGDESDCLHAEGTPEHAVWIAAYKEKCAWDTACAETSYEMSLERGYRQDRFSRRT